MKLGAFSKRKLGTWGVIASVSFMGAPAHAAGETCIALFANVTLQTALSQPATFMKYKQWVAERMLENISPYVDSNDHSKGFYKGMVTAADSHFDPSKGTPNYRYQWIRDAGITITMLTDLYVDEKDPARRNRILQMLMDHMAVIKKFQEQGNSSGDPGVVTKDGQTHYYENLGQTKTELDGSQSPPWMNPQIDGPAYSAKGLMRLADVIWDDWSTLFDKDSPVRTDLAKHDVYDASLDNGSRAQRGNISILKRYFEFLMHNWGVKSFDAWEEEHGSHFATLAAIQAALMTEGPEFTARVGDPGAGVEYKRVGQEIENELKKFWDSNRRVVVPSRDVDYSNLGHDGAPAKTSGIDSQVVIGFAHGKSPTFHASSDMVLSTVYEQEMVFKNMYPINRGQKAVLIGRYPEDIYSGAPGVLKGQPWFLNTFYFAEMSYKAGSDIYTLGQIRVTDLNERALNYVLEQVGESERVTAGTTLDPHQPLFLTLVDAFAKRGDLIVNRAMEFAAADGSMAEQIDPADDNVTGPTKQRSATKLTWSSAAFLRAAKARQIFQHFVTTLPAGNQQAFRSYSPSAPHK